MNFKKWAKSIKTAGYSGARTVDHIIMEFRKLFIEHLFDFLVAQINSKPNQDLEDVIHLQLTSIKSGYC